MTATRLRCAPGRPGPADRRTHVSVLVTDRRGRVLIDAATSGLPGDWVLTGGAVRGSAVGAVWRLAGLAPRLGEVLVVDVGPDAATRLVLDGGQLSGSAERAVQADRQAVLVDPARLPGDLATHARRRVLAALGARDAAGPVVLESGRHSPVSDLMRRYRVRPAVHGGGRWRWSPGPVPDSLRIQQVWVWVFVPDGRVVLYRDVHGEVGLPGGTLEPGEGRDAVAAAAREVHEEVRVQIAAPQLLGYLLDEGAGDGPVARVRLAARATRVHPAGTDPATGAVHRRLLVPAAWVPELCGWGPSAVPQLAAAVRAVRSWGVGGSVDDVSEVPDQGLGALVWAGVG